MNDTDKKIKDLFRKADEAAGYDPDREDTIRDMLVTSFKGKLKWMAVIVWVYMIVFTVLAVLVSVQFFKAEIVRDQIMWATAFACLIAFLTVTKLWYWMLINRNSIKRELKRLELTVAMLVEKIENQ